MLKNIKKILMVSGLLFLVFSLESCAGMQTYANAGVNVNFGPGGPRIDPYVNVGMYSGGGGGCYGCRY